MAVFRLHRMKDQARQQFRWAPHVSGATSVKPRDYQEPEVIEASGEYGCWRELKDTAKPLEVGDLLENEQGHLKIFKYVGFEPANWVLPVEHVPPPAAGAAAAVTQ